MVFFLVKLIIVYDKVEVMLLCFFFFGRFIIDLNCEIKILK